MIAQRRDANEPEIVEALRAAGCYVSRMDKGAGFDLLVVRDHVYVVEVKLPGKQNNLTPDERKTKAAIEAAGGQYYVVWNVEMALEILR